MKNNEKTYQTKDVYLAATLLALGYDIIDMPKKEKQFTFIFDNTEDRIEKDVDKYWSGDLSIKNVKSVFTSYRDLRARMFN